MKQTIFPSDREGHPFAIEDLEYIESGIVSHVEAYFKSQLPSGYTAPVIVEGVVVTKVGDDYTHTGGYIYYLGNLFTVNPLVVQLNTATPPNFILQETPQENNPVTYDDRSQHIVNIQYEIKLTDSAGLVQWNEIRRLEHIIFNRSKEINEAITLLTLPNSDFLTDNFTAGSGNTYGKYEGFALADGGNGTIDMAGKVAMGFNPQNTALTDVRDVGDYIVGTIGTFVGKFKHLLKSFESGNPALSGTTETPTGAGTDDLNFNNGTDVANGDKPADGTVNGTFSIVAHDAAVAFSTLQPSNISIIIQKVANIS